MLKHKSHDKINNDGRTESEKRKINEIHPDSGGFNTQLFAPPRANSESLRFKPIANVVYHASKLVLKTKLLT